MKEYDVTKEAAESGLEVFTLEFAEDRMAEVPSLVDSLSSKEHTLLHEITHKWIGFSRPYGFIWLEAAAQELKALVKAGKEEEAQSAIEKIRNYLEDKKSYLKENS